MWRRSEVLAVFKEASIDAVLMPMTAAARIGWPAEFTDIEETR